MEEPANITLGDVPTRIFEPAGQAIFHYSVSLVLGRNPIGSGTLVEVRGSYGILTAHHVADLLDSEPDEPLALVVRRDAHYFSIHRRLLHVVTIGKHSHSAYTIAGPDLAFIRILDPGKISTLQSIKSFCPLERRPFDPYRNIDFSGTFWMVCGAPQEHHRPPNTPDNDTDAFGVGQFAGLAAWHSHDVSNPFDRLTTVLVRDRERYPHWYGGVSGGGMWLIPVKMDHEVGLSSIVALPPVFAGVAYYQEVADDNMHIIGHGADSIYRGTTLDIIASAGQDL